MLLGGKEGPCDVIIMIIVIQIVQTFAQTEKRP